MIGEFEIKMFKLDPYEAELVNTIDAIDDELELCQNSTQYAILTAQKDVAQQLRAKYLEFKARENIETM